MEPLDIIQSATSAESDTVNQLRGWNEFQKVGEVITEMRRLGREGYVTELGIGSSGSAPA
jgi:hypothetical protein